MKKLIGVLCTVTILSACSTEAEMKQKAQSNRRGPMLNGSSQPLPNVAADSSIPPSVLTRREDSTGYMPLPPARSLQTTENYITPPLGNMNDISSRPSFAVSSNGPAMAGSSGRRAPELNRDALGQNTPSGDLLAPVPTTQTNAIPAISSASLSAPSASSMPSGSIVPPAPAFVPPAPVRSDDFPKLAQIPPALPAPQPTTVDPRVQSLKQEYASMNNEQALIQGGPTRVVVKSVSNGSVTSPSVSATSMPVPPAAPVIPEPPVFPQDRAANSENPGELRMPPAFAGRAAQQPQQPQQLAALPSAEARAVPPAPAALPKVSIAPAPVQPSAEYAQAPALLSSQPMAPQPPAQMSSSESMPSPGLMPMGPTVVVRSNRSAPKPVIEQQFAAPAAPVAPVVSAPLYTPPPAVLPPVSQPVAYAPAQVAYAPPPAVLPPVAPPAPPMQRLAPPPSVLPPVAPVASFNGGIQPVPAAQVSLRTLHSSLKPIPAEPVGPGTAEQQDDEYGTAPVSTTRVSDLKPISQQQYQALPDSRYARARQANRNNYQN